MKRFQMCAMSCNFGHIRVTNLEPIKTVSAVWKKYDNNNTYKNYTKPRTHTFLQPDRSKCSKFDKDRVICPTASLVTPQYARQSDLRLTHTASLLKALTFMKKEKMSICLYACMYVCVCEWVWRHHYIIPGRQELTAVEIYVLQDRSTCLQQRNKPCIWY